MPLGQLPRVPVEPIVGTVADTLIHFPSLYGTYGIDVLISNLDITNPLYVRVNKAINPKTIGASGEVALSNVIVEYLQITPNASTGSFEVLPFVIPRELLFE